MMVVNFKLVFLSARIFVFFGNATAADNAVISLFSISAIICVLCNRAGAPIPIATIIIRDAKYIAKIIAMPKHNQNQNERFIFGIIAHFLRIKKGRKIFFT